MNNAVIAQEGSPKDLYNNPKNKFVANFIGDANVLSSEVESKEANSYKIKLAEMKINIISEKNMTGNISVALRPEKININKNKSENNINAKVTNASFVGNSYQYILSTNIGKIYVISKDTINTFKINEEVFLSFDEKEVKVLND